MSWYGVLKRISWLLSYAVSRLTVEGREHIPRTGPFFLVANHQSVLDPILVQSQCPRPVHTFTKSTQFGSPTFRWLLPRVKAIPTRRYRVDPQVVRVALRLLENGEAVGVYPEGERTWDGTLQPFRRGTIRLLLKAGVPVIPCGVSGSYDVWPRWSRSVQRVPVTIRYGPPLHFGRHDDRGEREARVDEATRQIREAIEALLEPEERARGAVRIQGGGSAAIGAAAPERPRNHD